MAQPYVGEIRMFGGNFAPAGWEFCSGQLLSIADNETLFNLIGTTYGGDGQNVFALPDLRGRLPIHFGSGGAGSYQLAETGGLEQVTLTVNQIPNHTHNFLAVAAAGTSNNATNNLIAASPSVDMFGGISPDVNLNAAAIAQTGGNQPHTNFQPYLCVNFIISLFGIFPSPN
ncbi:MAG: tail fiber protein [Sphingomonas sp.]|uniref:phage tail protein n=1 Tax=Sphingomonas sp. TaxID=28214 RepID=UPI0025E7B3EF|nr:tail fiber protein [Sphingomonas sp.]MBY0284189.1 tail fiber protein [Sphingomonas sp.]